MKRERTNRPAARGADFGPLMGTGAMLLLGVLLSPTLPFTLGAHVAAQAPAVGEDQQVVLVTGSTDGLGREVARAVAGTGAHVIVHGRNRERGMELVAEIEAEGVGSARFYAADFGELEQVRELARAILEDYDRLDVLVNNAGIWLEADQGRVLSADGHELHFQVNYLAGFLLTRMLLPLLVESAPGRIVNVASGAQSPLDFGNVNLDVGYTDGRAYGQSKLAQILFTVDLAQELEGTGVIALSLHPATLMDTNMVLARGTAPRSSVEDGKRAVMHLITGEGLESGTYFNGTNPARANAQAYDAEARAALRELSAALAALELR
ncbi:MAG: SDR family NAD(P)-dependent oxidoreductase [Gemmatimonadota bacterium]